MTSFGNYMPATLTELLLKATVGALEFETVVGAVKALTLMSPHFSDATVV